MDYEALYNHLSTQMKRLGVVVPETEAEILTLTDSSISTAVLGNEILTKTIREQAAEAAKTTVEKTMLNKIEKEAKALGIENVEELGKGDVKTIMSLIDKKIKTDLGTSDEEKTQKLTEIQTKLREEELKRQELEQQLESKTTEFETTRQNDKKVFERNFSAHSIFSGLALNDNVKEKNKVFFDSLIAPALDQYQFDENGLAKKADGTPVFKSDKTSEIATMKDIILQKSTELGFVKSTDTKGGGSPNTETPPITHPVTKADPYGGQF